MKDDLVGKDGASEVVAGDTMAEDGATMLVENPGAVETEQLPPADTGMVGRSKAIASPARLDHLELPLEVRLGRLEQTLEQVLSLRVGDAVPVGPESDDQVTLYVQGRPYAIGDLMVSEGRFAFRVREVISSE